MQVLQITIFSKKSAGCMRPVGSLLPRRVFDNTTSCVSGHHWEVFQELTKSHIWDPEAYLEPKKFFFTTILIRLTTRVPQAPWPIFQDLADPLPQGTKDWFFRLSPNPKFDPERAILEEKKTTIVTKWLYI